MGKDGEIPALLLKGFRYMSPEERRLYRKMQKRVIRKHTQPRSKEQTTFLWIVIPLIALIFLGYVLRISGMWKGF